MVMRKLWTVEIVLLIGSVNLICCLGAMESEIVYFNEAKACKANEFFDIDHLKCKKCEESNSSKDRTYCECSPNTIERAEYDNFLQQPICERKCSQCSNSTVEIPISESLCPLRFFNLTNKRTNKKNIQIYRVTRNASCICDQKFNSLYKSNYCIPNAFLKDYASYGNYPVTQSKQPSLTALMFLCHDMRIRKECNYLANLCVLSDFNMDKNSPCGLFFKSQINDFVGGDTEQKIRPYLFYKKGRSTTDELGKTVDVQYKLRGQQEEQRFLNFTVLKFNLDGELQKFQDTTLQFLNLCARKFDNKRIEFAVSLRETCFVKLSQIAKYHQSSSGFYSVFLRYKYNKVNLLKAVPILVRSENRNNFERPERWQLVTRFFIADFISGAKSNYMPSPYSQDPPGSKFEVVRILKSTHLRIQTTTGNKIKTPLLVLEYGRYNLSEMRVVQDLQIGFKFEVTFEKGVDFDSFFEIMLPIFLILGFIIAIIDTISFKVRECKQFYDLHLFGKFLIFYLSKVSSTLFLVAVIVSIYIHFVYKTQNELKVILPNPVEEVVTHFLLIGFCLKTVKMVDHFYTVANIDIFFVDWERPKLNDNTCLKSNHLETPSSMGSRQTNFETNNVSAWRNYFIANEWQELTTKRKVSIFVHLLTMLILFFCVGMENFSSGLFYFHFKTANSDLKPKEMIILRISTGILVYLTSYFAQRFFNLVFWERYIKNPVQDFIDVCSIANVSVFILSLKSFGYYIHGRSPHGFSDTDMCSMIIQFKREEENMCGQRGLFPGSDQQTYSILAPKNLRLFYDRLVTPLQKPQQHWLNSNTANYSNGFDSGSGKQTNDRMTFEKTIMTYQNINRFFGAFIDHSLKDLDYVVRERSILESLLNCELELSAVSEDRGIFYIDNGHSFDEILFSGSENLLLQFEIMLFSVVVAFSGDFLLAIVVVGATSKIFEFLFTCVTKHNLARKTLIDKRFLI